MFSDIRRRSTKSVARILNDGEGIAGYELNVSCPNTKCGGIAFGSDPKMLYDVVRAVKKIASRPVIVKLSPNVTSIPRWRARPKMLEPTRSRW